MDRNFKMLLCDYGVVVVRQDADNEVAFNTLDEFKRYAHDLITTELDTKTYLCYMPENDVHTDEAESIQDWTGPVALYDTIIAAYPTLVTRKADRLYGLTGQELADEQAQIAFEDAERDRQTLILAEIQNDGLARLTPAQIDAHLDTVYDPTEFQAAADFASLKEAIGNVFARQKALDRKIGLRISRIYEPE